MVAGNAAIGMAWIFGLLAAIAVVGFLAILGWELVLEAVWPA
jgi:hypothetical protein